MNSYWFCCNVNSNDRYCKDDNIILVCFGIFFGGWCIGALSVCNSAHITVFLGGTGWRRLDKCHSEEALPTRVHSIAQKVLTRSATFFSFFSLSPIKQSIVFKNQLKQHILIDWLFFSVLQIEGKLNRPFITMILVWRKPSFFPLKSAILFSNN